MREVKFRAWDVERKAWMNEQDVYNEVQEQGRWNPERGERYKLMQYTGLLDRNGKKIYEGDKAKCFHPDYRGYFEGEIAYNDELACYVLIYYRDHGMGECVLYEFDDIEVIGNIHEKQALMENMERVK
jgi:uncharacterized phage protein (TIGR01671 family)